MWLYEQSCPMSHIFLTAPKPNCSDSPSYRTAVNWFLFTRKEPLNLSQPAKTRGPDTTSTTTTALLLHNLIRDMRTACENESSALSLRRRRRPRPRSDGPQQLQQTEFPAKFMCPPLNGRESLLLLCTIHMLHGTALIVAIETVIKGPLFIILSVISGAFLQLCVCGSNRLSCFGSHF